MIRFQRRAILLPRCGYAIFFCSALFFYTVFGDFFRHTEKLFLTSSTRLPISSSQNPKISRFLWLEIMFALVLWASAFPAIRVALRDYSPAHIALGRYLVASLTMGVLLLGQSFKTPARADWWRIFVAGFFGFTLYNIALNTGEKVVPAGTASFLVNTAPVWTLLVLTMTGRERVSARGWFGVMLSLCGVAIIALSHPDENGRLLRFDREFALGAGCILLAAFGTSFYVLQQKTLLSRYAPLQLTAWAIWAGTILMLPFGGGLIGEIKAASFAATFSVIYMGVLPGAVAYALWSRVLAQMDVSRAVSFIYLIPLFATAISWLWLGETLTPLAFFGGVVALGGVIWVNAAKKTAN